MFGTREVVNGSSMQCILVYLVQNHCNFVKFKSSNYTDFPQEAMRASKDGNHISESFLQSFT